MNHKQLPSMRSLVENVTLDKAKLDKILSDSQSRVASYLDVRYPDSQDIIFLLGGKAVKAGRYFPQGREIQTVSQALEKLHHQKQGTIGFHEISKLLMIIIMGTFIFEPTHGRLKAKLINFNSLLDLFKRKRFTGYLELDTHNTLNYLTFHNGQAREGYFALEVTPEQMEFPVKLISQMVNQSDENSEINVYESVGEENLHENVPKPEDKPLEETAPNEEFEKDQFTSEILDLCLVAIYEDLFRIMVTVSNQQLDSKQTENMFRECLNQAMKNHPQLFRTAGIREDGSVLVGGSINFEHLLKAKSTIPHTQREQEFLKGMNTLMSLRLKAMQRVLIKNLFEQALAELNGKVASNKKNYQGNFTINKFLYEISRGLEKIRSEASSG